MNDINEPNNAFIAEMQRIEALFKELNSLKDNHFEFNPDDINWTHVCMLRELTNRLGESLTPWRNLNTIQKMLLSQEGEDS